jgi:glycosyltransferase involved in cell wall biosynthesis
MPIKILVISNYRAYHTSRPEAETFIGLAKSGFDITIMTYGDSKYVSEFERAGIRIIDFHPEKKLNRKEIACIREELINGGYDILHLFNSKAVVNGVQAAKGLPVKVIVYRGYTGNVHWYDPTAYLKSLNPRVDKIVCNSKGVEDDIHRQLFFDKRKTITINKGHRLEWYSDYKPANLNKEFHLPANAFVVVSVANNRRMKGIPWLLKAMNHLPESNPIYLLLVGKNMDSKKNMRLINRSPNRKKILLTGFRTDVLNIVAASHVFALASIKGESITKSVIEAMALGVAPVITDIPGNMELVEHHKNGLVVPARNAEKLGKAFLYLYDNPDLCKRMGKESQKRIETTLNLEKTIIQTGELYKSICSDQNNNLK